MSQNPQIFIGSYSDSKPAPAIYELGSDSANPIDIPLVNPSYIFTRGQFIYAVEETNGGRLNTLKRNYTGKYEIVKTNETQGNDPCHISINNSGTRLVVSNYTSGSFIIYELEDGIPTKTLIFKYHKGKSVHPQRQTEAHVHCSLFSEDDSILFISDLGTDTIYFYYLPENNSHYLTLNYNKSIKIEGSGPRHLAHGKYGDKIIYLSCYLDSTVRTLSYVNGGLELLSTTKTSLNDGLNFASYILYANGTVYVANRGDNYVIVLEEYHQGDKYQKERFRFRVGNWPRHIALSRDGKLIYVAAQLDNVVYTYELQKNTAKLVSSVKVSTPSVIAFVN